MDHWTTLKSGLASPLIIPNPSPAPQLLPMAALRFQTLISPHTFLPFFFFIFSSSSSSFISLAAESNASEDDFPYTKCRIPFTCGPLSTGNNITYPFWGNSRPNYCGLDGFELVCQHDEAFMDFEDQRYRVLDINQTGHVMTVARDDLWSNPCLQLDLMRNTTMNNNTLFDYTSGVKNLSIFYCPDPGPELSSVPGGVPCPLEGYLHRIALLMEDEFVDRERRDYPGLSQCNIVKVPVLQSALDEVKPVLGTDWIKVFRRGFELAYKKDQVCSGCESSGGICGTNLSYPYNFTCYCSHKLYPYACPHPGRSKTWKKAVTGVASGGGVALIFIALIFFVRYRNRKKPGQSYAVSRSISSAFSSRTDFEKGDLYYGLPIFDYDELREATNNFDPQKELGDGGFGTVFYGKLRDGRSVAVKRLYENNYKRVEQFMNEIEILARLRHPNLVILYGCTSRQSHRLLLVYEYVPNGTVADHLHGDLAKPGSLPWSTRLKIAIETASALVYLHATDIIHRDVKTNNILLDENFSVKVADFGLSRLFPFNVTHVSTAPQGTPGYVDPEYHQCYQLTEKSDVYSFGVVLMELVSSLPAVDITRHRHEINLSTMAINKIHNHALHELVDPNLGFNSDCDIRTMITAVAELGFWCLQNAKDMRPSMAEVLSTLKDIQKQGTDGNKNAVENDDAALLRANPPSPNSVMAKFISTSTTPNTSG